MARSTSFVLTICTIPYPQGHSGLLNYENPLASAPFLLDKEDASPVYSLMHQSFSDNRQKSHNAETAVVPTFTALDTDQTETTPSPLPGTHRIWALDHDAGDALFQWQTVILIQHGQDIGFTQAPIRTRLESTRTSGTEKYKGHVVQVLVEVSPTESIGNIVHKALMECYPLRSTVPAPDTLHYTLGKFPSSLVWAQEQTTEHSLHLNARTRRELSLSYEDKLECITQEDSNILVFLPLPVTDRTTSPQIHVDMLAAAQLQEHVDVCGSRVSNPLLKQQQLHDQIRSLSHQGESLRKRQGDDLIQGQTLPSLHQIFVRIPDTWTEKGRKPTFTQTMHVPTSLDSLKEGLSLLLSIPTTLSVCYTGGKYLITRSHWKHRESLRTQQSS